MPVIQCGLCREPFSISEAAFNAFLETRRTLIEAHSKDAEVEAKLCCMKCKKKMYPDAKPGQRKVMFNVDADADREYETEREFERIVDLGSPPEGDGVEDDSNTNKPLNAFLAVIGKCQARIALIVAELAEGRRLETDGGVKGSEMGMYMSAVQEKLNRAIMAVIGDDDSKEVEVKPDYHQCRRAFIRLLQTAMDHLQEAEDKYVQARRFAD